MASHVWKLNRGMLACTCCLRCIQLSLEGRAALSGLGSRSGLLRVCCRAGILQRCTLLRQKIDLSQPLIRSVIERAELLSSHAQPTNLLRTRMLRYWVSGQAEPSWQPRWHLCSDSAPALSAALPPAAAAHLLRRSQLRTELLAGLVGLALRPACLLQPGSQLGALLADALQLLLGGPAWHAVLSWGCKHATMICSG